MDLKPTLIFDDIISKEQQLEFHNLVLNYPHWKFIKDMSYAQTELQYPSYGFNAAFKHPDHGIVSNLYEAVSVPIINEVIKKIDFKVSEIYFNRAFLQVPLDSKFVKENNGIHIDIPKEHYACIYYLNDSDGDTIIYDQTMHDTEAGSKNVEVTVHKRVTPKQGRVVLFDGMRYHCSTQPKNGYRCIVNFDLI